MIVGYCLCLLFFSYSLTFGATHDAFSEKGPLPLSNIEYNQSTLHKIENMFAHAYFNYMEHAFPFGELKPRSCSKSEPYFGKGLPWTLIDSLDSLLVFGYEEEFEKNVQYVINHFPNFNLDRNVSVFETNIRILGGLLSAHLFLDPEFNSQVRPNNKTPYKPKFNYTNQLLNLSIDLANRLLPAFQTPTGIPYGTVNLQYGVPVGETPVVCTAAATTFSLEFGILSRLTHEPIYEQTARKAVRAIVAHRSSIGLVGDHINATSGVWVYHNSGVGMGIDSFYEYLLKTALFFNDQEYMNMFAAVLQPLTQYCTIGPTWIDVNMKSGAPSFLWYDNLQAFWPGTQTLLGDFPSALPTIKYMWKIWASWGLSPEKLYLGSGKIPAGKNGYPLRPEFIESLFYAERSHSSPAWRRMARFIFDSIETYCRAECGYQIIKDVDTMETDDRMESYFLAETVKYLYLIFKEDHWLNTGNFLFSTEAHPFPFHFKFSNTDVIYDGEEQICTPGSPYICLAPQRETLETLFYAEEEFPNEFKSCPIFLFEVPPDPEDMEELIETMDVNQLREYFNRPGVISHNPNPKAFSDYVALKSRFLQLTAKSPKKERVDDNEVLDEDFFDDLDYDLDGDYDDEN